MSFCQEIDTSTLCDISYIKLFHVHHTMMQVHFNFFVIVIKFKVNRYSLVNEGLQVFPY